MVFKSLINYFHKEKLSDVDEAKKVIDDFNSGMRISGENIGLVLKQTATHTATPDWR